MAYLHVEIRDDQAEALNRHLTAHGMKKRVVGKLIDQLIEVLEGPHGVYALGALMADELTLAKAFEPDGSRTTGSVGSG